MGSADRATEQHAPSQSQQLIDILSLPPFQELQAASSEGQQQQKNIPVAYASNASTFNPFVYVVCLPFDQWLICGKRNRRSMRDFDWETPL